MTPMITLLLCLGQAAVVASSVGDRTWHFQKCLRGCEGKECSRISDADYALTQPFYMRWLQWSCSDECDYQCMWDTVEAFRMDGTKVPQFHGKWPFIRLLGVQEPASTIFSILNGVAHFVMLLMFWRKIGKDYPMFYIWTAYALIAMNAWVFSTIFHARDTILTETLDYSCAVSLTVYSLFALCARVLGSDRPWSITMCGVALLTFFTHHTHYLLYVKFDYGYNMIVNIVVGSLNGAGWILWCIAVRKEQKYAWKAAVSVFLLSALILLELLDFPPIFWTFDAHSLWHAGTVPLPFLWYSFLIDDCRYLMVRSKHLTLPETEREKIQDKKIS